MKQQRPRGSSAAGGGGAPSTPAPAPATPKKSCVKPSDVQNITFSATKYPKIRQHFLKALRKGWPRILVVNRPGADARRTRLLDGVPTRGGYDRDEYPPAVGRGKGFRVRGINPRGWMGVTSRHLCNSLREKREWSGPRLTDI